MHLTQIAGDKMQKVDLCEDCAKSKGVNDPAGFSLADLLLGLGAAKEIEQPAPAGEENRCPACNFTQTDFKKSGRFGCPECYQTFAEGLESLLKPMHKGLRHQGKVPQARRSPEDLNAQLRTLESRLLKLIAEENFEQAACCRDEIKATREKLASLAA